MSELQIFEPTSVQVRAKPTTLATAATKSQPREKKELRAPINPVVIALDKTIILQGLDRNIYTYIYIYMQAYDSLRLVLSPLSARQRTGFISQLA